MTARLDPSALAKAIAPVIREFVAKAMAEVPAGRDGKNAYDLACSLGFDGDVYAWLDSLKGDGADPEDVGRLIDDGLTEKLLEAITTIPAPKNGKDGVSITAEDVRPLVEELVQAAVAQLPPPAPGKDGTSVAVEDVRPLIEHLVAEIPRPEKGRDGAPGKDGTSVTLDDLRPMMESALAQWALDCERRNTDLIQRCIDRIEKPKDGKDGKDGRDAFELEDLEMGFDIDSRTLTVGLVRGEERIERSITLSVPLYHDVWRPGAEAKRGDCYTFGGSVFIAVEDTQTKPGSASWRLAVKRGRDGRDGGKGPKGDPGKDGQP